MAQANQPTPSQLLTPELRSVLTSRTDRFLVNIIKANSGTQYATQAPCLTAFRDTILRDATRDNATLVQDFRDQVPVTDYDSYKDWVARFDERPCQESHVKDLLAPGLPYYFAVSSSTSGKEPKLFPSYQHASSEDPPLRQFYDFSDAQGPTAWVFYYGYKELREVEREPGHVVKRIPLCLASGGGLRMRFGWDVESDETRMSTILPGQVAPWAANLIVHHRTFLVIHALFCLACRDLDQIFMTFTMFFVDFAHHIDEEWDMLVACISDGTIPQLDGIAHLRVPLQAPFRSDPERAEELRKIGPPSSCEGWASLVWPRLRRLAGICSGSFATSLPQVKSILGPMVAIRNHGYASSESLMSVHFNPKELDVFVFETEDVLEFVHADAEATSANILQGWNLEAGKHYQIVITTRNGLWRYLLDDIIEVVGFAPRNGSPVFKYSGRKTSLIQLAHINISDAELIAAIQKVNSADSTQVIDFTTVHDERTTPLAVGFFVELTGLPVPNSYFTRQRLFDILADTNIGYQRSFAAGGTRLPTIRVVKPGTFMDYRRWRGEKMNIGLGQVKVPVVLSHLESQEWIQARVIQEL